MLRTRYFRTQNSHSDLFAGTRFILRPTPSQPFLSPSLSLPICVSLPHLSLICLEMRKEERNEREKKNFQYAKTSAEFCVCPLPLALSSAFRFPVSLQFVAAQGGRWSPYFVSKRGHLCVPLSNSACFLKFSLLFFQVPFIGTNSKLLRFLKIENGQISSSFIRIFPLPAF